MEMCGWTRGVDLTGMCEWSGDVSLMEMCGWIGDVRLTEMCRWAGDVNLTGSHAAKLVGNKSVPRALTQAR